MSLDLILISMCCVQIEQIRDDKLPVSILSNYEMSFGFVQ